MIKQAWRAMEAWLLGIPVSDPVDRRNAAFVQVLLIVMGCVVPVNKLGQLQFTSYRRSMSMHAFIMDIVTDVVMTAAAWGCFYLIRTGRFRRGVRLYLVVMLSAAALAYSQIGLERLTNDPFPLLLLGLGGLALGRRELWAVLGVLLAIFGLGIASDLAQHIARGPWDWEINNKAPMVVSYLIVALMLDRTISALRLSLTESNARGQMLQVVNARLHREMEDRARAQQLLVHAQKLETVGRVAGGVAHDFSNVLGVILGYAQRRERLADSGTQALVDAMQGVEKAAHRGMSVTGRLLTFSRQEPTRLEVLPVGEALRTLLPMMCQLFAANVHVELKECSESLAIRFDRTQLELLVLNVAANARDAMPNGGVFCMGVQLDEASNMVELVLSDSGIGMSEEVKARIFEAFFTTKPAGSGTGLGLAVVNDLVSAAGGCIEVHSAPGLGTSFRIGLPRTHVSVEETGLHA